MTDSCNGFRRYTVHEAASRPRKQTPLPPDYVGDFATPDRTGDCCVVVRTTQRDGNGEPRRCRARRLASATKGGERPLCCLKHAALEDAARTWRKRHEFWASIHRSAARTKCLPAWTQGGIVLSHNFEGGVKADRKADESKS